MKSKLRRNLGRLTGRGDGSPAEAGVRRLHALFSAIGADWEKARERGNRRASGSYLGGFDTEDKIRDRQAMYTQCLAHIDDLDKTVGCDVGCWLGFSAAMLRSLGPRLVYGVEVVEEFTAEAEQWRRAHDVEGVRFRAMREGTIPLLSQSIDWVLINQVMCNAVRDSFESSLRETFRILRPGGWLVFCDSNNPYCPDTWVRLEKSYRLNELGANGTPEQPDGPYFRRRRRFIHEIAPDLDDDAVHRLARETCYHLRDEVIAAVAVFRDTGRSPMSVFEPGARRTPWNLAGGSAGTVTDPYAIAGDLERIGFEPPSVSVSARCEAVDNEVLWDQLARTQGFFVFARRPIR